MISIDAVIIICTYCISTNEADNWYLTTSKDIDVGVIKKNRIS